MNDRFKKAYWAIILGFYAFMWLTTTALVAWQTRGLWQTIATFLVFVDVLTAILWWLQPWLSGWEQSDRDKMLRWRMTVTLMIVTVAVFVMAWLEKA